MTKTIKHQFFFAHPPATVWEYLTTAELMGQWLMPNDFQPIVGLDFQFTTKPIPNLNFDGIFYCKVLELVPFKKLTYSWKAGPGQGEITLESIVRWNLEAKDGGTELFLEHSGFERPENENFYNGLLQGWATKFPKIAELLKAAQHGNTVA